MARLRIALMDIHAYQVKVVSYKEIWNRYYAVMELT
jgi:hypothetical protein